MDKGYESPEESGVLPIVRANPLRLQLTLDQAIMEQLQQYLEHYNNTECLFSITENGVTIELRHLV